MPYFVHSDSRVSGLSSSHQFDRLLISRQMDSQTARQCLHPWDSAQSFISLVLWQGLWLCYGEVARPQALAREANLTPERPSKQILTCYQEGATQIIYPDFRRLPADS